MIVIQFLYIVDSSLFVSSGKCFVFAEFKFSGWGQKNKSLTEKQILLTAIVQSKWSNPQKNKKNKLSFIFAEVKLSVYITTKMKLNSIKE